VDVQQRDPLGRIVLQRLRQQALDEADAVVAVEALQDFVEQPILLADERMVFDRVVVVGVVAPERLVEVFLAEVVDDGLDAGTAVHAAFDEVAFQLGAVIRGTGQDVAAPGDRPVGVVLDIAVPGGDETRILERRIAPAPEEHVVAQVGAGRAQGLRFVHQLVEAHRVGQAPDGADHEAHDPVRVLDGGMRR
ncbi:conserved hypothetical protein, partial [Ricinus communis]